MTAAAAAIIRQNGVTEQPGPASKEAVQTSTSGPSWQEKLMDGALIVGTAVMGTTDLLMGDWLGSISWFCLTVASILRALDTLLPAALVIDTTGAVLAMLDLAIRVTTLV